MPAFSSVFCAAVRAENAVHCIFEKNRGPACSGPRFRVYQVVRPGPLPGAPGGGINGLRPPGPSRGPAPVVLRTRPLRKGYICGLIAPLRGPIHLTAVDHPLSQGGATLSLRWRGRVMRPGPLPGAPACGINALRAPRLRRAPTALRTRPLRKGYICGFIGPLRGPIHLTAVDPHP